jgi:hypothetical protein
VSIASTPRLYQTCPCRFFARRLVNVLHEFIEEALTTTDLYKVALLSTSSSREVKGTTASTNKRLGVRLKAAASCRCCSANSLANSAVAAWLSSK